MLYCKQIFVVSFLLVIMVKAKYVHKNCTCWPGYIPDLDKKQDKLVCIRMWRYRSKMKIPIVDQQNFVECNTPDPNTRPECKCTGGLIVVAFPNDWCKKNKKGRTKTWKCENQDDIDLYERNRFINL